MIGQVIEKDYQLYVKNDKGTYILGDSLHCNCPGGWRDFDFPIHKDGNLVVTGSSTDLFETKESLEKYLHCITNFEKEKNQVKYQVKFREALNLFKKQRILYVDIIKWRNDNGYPKFKNTHPMHHRMLKVQKLIQKLKNDKINF